MIRIELKIRGTAPRGRVTAAGGDTRDFDGWVGLMSAVDDLAARETDPEPEE